MNRQNQLNIIRINREEIITELEMFYQKSFEKLTKLGLTEASIAKFTQLLLQSKEGALTPMRKEIEKPLITKAPAK